MAVQLNHTIVWCSDQKRSAAFLTEILGLPAATVFGPFLVVELDNPSRSTSTKGRRGRSAALRVPGRRGRLRRDLRRIGCQRDRLLAHPMRSSPGKINHTTADAACTSRIRTTTRSRSSPALRTAADLRAQACSAALRPPQFGLSPLVAHRSRRSANRTEQMPLAPRDPAL